MTYFGVPDLQVILWRLFIGCQDDLLALKVIWWICYMSNIIYR